MVNDEIIKEINIEQLDRKVLNELIDMIYIIDKNNIKYDLSQAKVYEIEQTYINFSPEIRVRRVNNSQYSFTLKKNMSEDGMVRDEIDFLITEEEYNELVTKKVGNTIYKTRYKILKDEQIIIDGKKEIRKLCEFGVNLDERIGDGFYFLK